MREERKTFVSKSPVNSSSSSFVRIEQWRSPHFLKGVRMFIRFIAALEGISHFSTQEAEI
jgi:hypothetical protein